jgi:hypothetical protein
MMNNRKNEPGLATFVQSGRDWEVILIMEELKRWPDAHAWLRGRLGNELSPIQRRASGPDC